jgi:hydrolase, carbon-nitrogen family
MKLLKIALLQLKPCNTLQKNKIKGIEYCKKAKEMDVDIALFPEMWSNGYQIYNRDIEEWKKEAIDKNDDFVLSFSRLAKELNMAIGLTFLEKYENNPRNTMILFDRYGEQKLVYAKVHTCDFDVEKNLTPGDDFYVTELDTKQGNIKVGVMICFDREFPESARILMLKGAELILVPNACPMEINRLSQLRGRAYENMLAIATCNYPTGVPDCNGHSSVFDGVAYIPNMEGSRDTCIMEASEEEGIYVANLDIKQLRKYRLEEVHGNAYRHPEKYKCLLDKKVEEPFIRNCSKRETKDLF